MWASTPRPRQPAFIFESHMVHKKSPLFVYQVKMRLQRKDNRNSMRDNISTTGSSNSSNNCSNSSGSSDDDASISSCWNSGASSESSSVAGSDAAIYKQNEQNDDIHPNLEHFHSSLLSSIAAAVLRRRPGGGDDAGSRRRNDDTQVLIHDRVNNKMHDGRDQRKQKRQYTMQSSQQLLLCNNCFPWKQQKWSKRHRNLTTQSFNKATQKRVWKHSNRMSTCILCCSIGFWLFVVLFSNKDSNNNSHMISSQHHHHPELTIRQRIRVRSRYSKQSWIAKVWNRMTTFIFGHKLPPNNIPINQDIIKKKDSEELPPECVRPPWHHYNFPTCNDIYEVDLPSILRQSSKVQNYIYQDSNSSSGTHIPLGYVAKGLWRAVWAVNPRSVMTEPIVLKTMRRDHELTSRNYDRHRRDAIVMEQLTSSPYVVNIYGFCGNSVLTEYMDTTLDDVIYGDEDGTIDLVIGSKRVNVTSATKVQWALDVTRGVQALHELSGGPIVHTDIQAKQFLISPTTGIVKINDFNRCRFMAKSNVTGRPCKFRIPSAPGKSRAPEEYNFEDLDEKLDVYSVANILYSILTQREPWDGWNGIVAQTRIQEGVIPEINTNSIQDLPIIVQESLINVTKQAYMLDPNVRISAAELATVLERILRDVL
jgi:Protein kinase domain